MAPRRLHQPHQAFAAGVGAHHAAAERDAQAFFGLEVGASQRHLAELDQLTHAGHQHVGGEPVVALERVDHHRQARRDLARREPLGDGPEPRRRRRVEGLRERVGQRRRPTAAVDGPEHADDRAADEVVAAAFVAEGEAAAPDARQLAARSPRDGERSRPRPERQPWALPQTGGRGRDDVAYDRERQQHWH